MQPIHERQELKSYYQDAERAASYVDLRFEDARGRLLHRRQVDLLNALIEHLPERRALELAVGPARVTQDVRGLHEAVGVDASPQMLELARQRVSKEVWELREADIFELSLGRSFPLVYSFRFVRHLQLEQRRAVYARVAEHLEPNGIFLFDACNAVVEEPLRRAHPENYPVFDQLYRREELINEMEASGFRVDSLTPILRHYGTQRLLSRLGRIAMAPLFQRAVDLVETLPGNQPLEWAVSCRRA